MITIFQTFKRDFNRTRKGKAVADLISAIENGDTDVNTDHAIIVALLTYNC